MAPFEASFASWRRMECSTSAAGERLKWVRPSLSNSATSLTCIVVAIKSPQKRAREVLGQKALYSPLKVARLPRTGITTRNALSIYLQDNRDVAVRPHFQTHVRSWRRGR